MIIGATLESKGDDGHKECLLFGFVADKIKNVIQKMDISEDKRPHSRLPALLCSIC